MPILGIDIGNENISVSVYKNDQFTVILGDDEKTTTPSYVAYTGSDWLVGASAKAEMKTNYRNTVYDFPSLLGKRMVDLPAAQMEHWCFDFAEKDGDLVIIFQADGMKQVFTPEFVLTHLLKRIRINVNEQLDKTVTDVVIAVPCHLGLRSRLAVKNAAWSAGFNVRKLINKPIAAAMACCPQALLHQRGNLLVIDVGARRIEVTVFSVDRGLLRQRTHLASYPEGGWLCDDRLAKTFLIPLLRKEKVREDEVAALISLHQVSEALKQQLTTSKKAKAHAEGLSAPKKTTYFSLSRKRFDKHNIRLFSELETCLNSTMAAVGLIRMDVDCVVLTGGASRILQLQTLLFNMFGDDRVLTNVDPSLAVSYGAAVQGAMLEDKSRNFPFPTVQPDQTEKESDSEFLLSLDSKNSYLKQQSSNVYQSETLDYFRMLRTTADDVSCPNQPMVTELHTRFKMKCDSIIQLLQTNRSMDLTRLQQMRQEISEDWSGFTCRLLKLLVSSSAIGARDQETRVTRRQEVTSFVISIRKRLDSRTVKQAEELRTMCDNLLQYIGHHELLDFDRMSVMRQFLEQKWKQFQAETHVSARSENSVASSDDMVYTLPGDDVNSDTESPSRRTKLNF